MLATSGDQAYLLLNNYTHNKKRAFTILEETLASNKTLAYLILKRNGLSDEQAIKVLNYTHPSNPRPFILIINTDMENQIINAANYQGNPYSIIENGTEKFVDKKGNFSIIITKNKTLIVNKNYRNSLIIKLLTGEADSMKVFENKKNKNYSFWIVESRAAFITSVMFPAIVSAIPLTYTPTTITITSNAPMINIISALTWASSSNKIIKLLLLYSSSQFVLYTCFTTHVLSYLLYVITN